MEKGRLGKRELGIFCEGLLCVLKGKFESTCDEVQRFVMNNDTS